MEKKIEFDTDRHRSALTMDEESAMEFLHDSSMSKDELVACGGRALKELAPVFLRWMDSERGRRTAPPTLCAATIDVAVSFLSTCVMTLAKDQRHAAEGMEIMAGLMQVRLAECIAMIRDQQEIDAFMAKIRREVDQ